MVFDIAIVGTWIAFAMSLFALIGVVKGFLSSGTKENSSAILALRDSCESLSNRLSNVENELKHFPTSKEFNALGITIVRMEGDLKLITKTTEGAERTSRRIEDFLITKGAQ